ncbi:MAG: L-2-amino-thiazoline-4-carboxylic acid hydrolase [Erysipelotrichaceae bacterium]|nr:L-2-amino-thiazoline-4-carboxylic acid hydrolase [Erysipelotrichaceae bacterium]
MINNHIQIQSLSYVKPVQRWLKDRYGKDEANKIWAQVCDQYNKWLLDLPDYGGKRNGHAKAIYGGLLVFALYVSLPDHPPVEELGNFVQKLFMGPFTKLGKVFNLNRSLDMWIIDHIFRMSGNRDRKDILKYPSGFINVDEDYDKEHHVARYHFTQCPNADFAKSHDLIHVLPLLCNSDFFGISEIHGQLIRCGTCGNSSVCDYMVMGSQNPLADEYETITDSQGFLVSRKKDNS